MSKNLNMQFSDCNKLAYDELDDINALVLVTKDFCERKEYSAEYYGASKHCATEISEERNHYIRIFDMILAKIVKVTNLNESMESAWNYKSTPTIAADK